MRPWSAGTVTPAGLFVMLFVCHVDEIGFVRRLYKLFWRYRERSTEEKGLDWLSLCCFDVSSDGSYLVRDAKNW